MKFFKYAALFFIAGFFLSSAPHAHAGTCASAGSGAWNTGGTWTAGCTGPGGVPYVGDVVTITTGHTVTVNVITWGVGSITVNGLLDNSTGYAITAGSVVINSGGEFRQGTGPHLFLTGTSGTLFTLNSGGIFTQGTSTVNLTGNGDATIASGSPTFYNLTISGTGTKSQGSEITFASGGTFSVTSGTFSALGDSINTSGSNTLTVSNATITVPTAFHVDYPFATVNLNTGSTVDYNEGSPQTVYQALTYYNLKISGSFSKNISGTTTVTNTLDLTSATFDTDGYTLNVGNIAMNGGTFTPESSTVNLTGTSGTLITINSGTITPGTSTFNATGNGDATILAGGQSFYNFTSSGTGTKTMGGAMTVDGTLSITNGTFATGSSAAFSNSGTLSVTNATLKVQGTQFTDSFTGFGTVSFGSGSTVDYYRGGNQTISAAYTYNNLTTSGSGTKTLAGNTTVTGTLSIDAGTLDTDGTGNYELTVGHIIFNAGTFTANASTVNVTGTSGTLMLVGLGGGSFNAGTSTFNLTGNGDAVALSGGVSFYNLISSGTGTKSVVSGGFTILSGGTFSVTNGTFDPGTTRQRVITTATLSITNATLNIGGATFEANFDGYTPTFGTGSTVNYKRAGDQTIYNSAHYYNLILSGGPKTVTFPTSGITTVTNSFNAQGTLGNRITLVSNTSGTQWRFDPAGSASASYADVRDSACTSNAIFVTQTEVTDLGNNGTCWVRRTGRGAVNLRIAAASANSGKLDFTINDGAKVTKSAALTLALNANPTTVSGYAVSLNPNFADIGIRPYPATSVDTFTLPEKTGIYTLYVLYFSTTGHRSDVISHTISYQPNATVAVTNLDTNTSFNRSLRLGSQGGDVVILQKFLIRNGNLAWPEGAAYGYYGKLTKKAVQVFQEKYGIATKSTIGYGIFGPKTRAKVVQIIEGSLSTN